jgi:REP element-mobilizing transposase RayT
LRFVADQRAKFVVLEQMFGMDEDFLIYTRHMPHWRKRGAIYDVGWSTYPDAYPLAMEERSVVVDALKHFDGARYELFGYVVMDDHVHILVQPAPSWPLSVLMHSWRSYSANQLQRRFGRSNDVWLTDYWNRIVRSDREFRKKQKYILDNAVERWGITDYPFAWCKKVPL